MIFTTHAITGAAVGIATGNPVLAFAGGFFSHFLLDAIPHFDQGSFYTNKDKGPAWLGARYEDKKNKFKGKEALRDWSMLFLDFAICGIIFLYFLASISPDLWLNMILGAVGGATPDIFDTSPLWKYKFRKTFCGKFLHKIHLFFHWPLSVKYWHIGILTQILLIVLGIWYILY